MLFSMELIDRVDDDESSSDRSNDGDESECLPRYKCELEFRLEGEDFISDSLLKDLSSEVYIIGVFSEELFRSELLV